MFPIFSIIEISFIAFKEQINYGEGFILTNQTMKIFFLEIYNFQIFSVPVSYGIIPLLNMKLLKYQLFIFLVYFFPLRPLSCQKLILILSIKLSKSSPQPSNQLKIQHSQKQKPDEIKSKELQNTGRVK